MMRKMAKRVAAGVGLLAMSAGQSVWAALPTPVAPSTAPAAGDWIGLIKGYIKDGGLVLGLAIAVLGFEIAVAAVIVGVLAAEVEGAVGQGVVVEPEGEAARL